MNPLFKLCDDASVSDVTAYLSMLIYQSRAMQSALQKLSNNKAEIADNLDDIGGLIAQTEATLEQVVQLTEFLESKNLQVVAV